MLAPVGASGGCLEKALLPTMAVHPRNQKSPQVQELAGFLIPAIQNRFFPWTHHGRKFVRNRA